VSSHFGQIFRISTFGESHGPGVGVVIDGCPAGIEIDFNSVQKELTRRRPGQSHLTTPRNEADELEVLSGIYNGRSLGSPIAILVRNKDVHSTDYERWADIYRPSHADFTYHAKYGFRTPLGGGRASVREAIGRVAAGAIAAQILKRELGTEAIAWVDSVGGVEANLMDRPPATVEEVDASIVRCPEPEASERMIELIESIKRDGDSIGGTIGVVVRNIPPGLGDPVFDRLEADLAKASLSIPACKGFESGSGFMGTRLRGGEHNDTFLPGASGASTGPSDRFPAPDVHTLTNRSGGIQGGISNGMPLLMRLAFKPTSTIRKDQQSVNERGETVSLKAGGRHDPCVLPRAVPIVEGMVNLVLIDAVFRQRAVHPEWWERYRRV
jgi:chorismate synthase